MWENVQSVSDADALKNPEFKPVSVSAGKGRDSPTVRYVFSERTRSHIYQGNSPSFE